MNKLIVILSLLITPPNKESNCYEKIYASEYKNALQFICAHNKTLASSAKKYEHSTKLLSAIIFPELIRYNYLNDIMETSALEIVYTEHGSSIADFSVGRFQMKPSFAEDIENQITKNDSLSKIYKNLISFVSKEDKLQRKERLARLVNPNWQLTYLNAFVSLMEIKFQSQNFDSLKSKIEFYAAAYNGGWHRSAEKIKASQSQAWFPYGPNYKGKQYAYAEVASYFYERTFKE